MKNRLNRYRTIDINHLPQAYRDLRLLEAVLCLEPGCSFLIKLNESPKFLIAHLENELTNKFKYKILQAGPDVWLIQVTRIDDWAA